MAGHPGYLLPDGECFTEEMACALVFYPDKPEYRRALFGSLVYLSTWLAWERDADKRGKDAARAWKDAVDLTVECMNMACLEELIADIAAIRNLMETKKDCCDTNISYYPIDEPTTDIEPGVGDAPEFYGETEITDWDDWAEHVCYNAHKYVDYLKDTSEQLQEAVSLSSIFIGLIGATLGLLAFSGLLLTVPFALAAGVVAGLVLLATSSTFQDTSDDFESAREDIVCAILNGASLSAAVEAALLSGTDWDLFYQFVDYDSAIAIIYEGGWGTEYLPEETRDDCVCEVGELLLFTFDDDVEDWSGGTLIYEWNAGEFIEIRRSNDSSWGQTQMHNWGDLETRFGFSGPEEYDQLRFKWYNHKGSGSAMRWKFYFKIVGDQNTYVSPEIDSNDYTDSEWHETIFNMDKVYESGENHDAIHMWMFMYSAPVQGQRIHLDDFGLYKK